MFSQLIRWLWTPSSLFFRKFASRAWGVLVGILLILCIRVWPDNDAKSPPIRIAPRDTEIGNFGDGTDVRFNATLIPRQDHQCGPGNPCNNGACCGGSGYCGYGPTYCGSGCVSNCDAVAECGQYAKTPGARCPLNTCCSQYGFVCSPITNTHVLEANILSYLSVVPRKTFARVRAYFTFIGLSVGSY
jgi:hypothetical protein